MTRVQHVRGVVIVLDPTSTAQADTAEAFIRRCPSHLSMSARPVRAEEALPPSVADADVIVLLAGTRSEEMRGLLAGSNAPRLVAVPLDPWPSGLLRFEECYRQADLVLIEDGRLWWRQGCPARTHLLPLALDEETFRCWGSSKDRGCRTLWILPPRAEYPYGYEPWLPGPESLVKGTEFEGLASLPDDVHPLERASVFNCVAVVVCASDSPMSRKTLFEAAACGCSVVITQRANRAGIVQDGITGVVVESNGRMLRGLRAALRHRSMLSANMTEAICAMAWPGLDPSVYQLIDTPRDGDGPGCTLADLTDEVTVFVSTVGAASFRSCMDHLNRQDCRFRLQVINNIAPMSAAFQMMLDSCSTPYYVQVDEDMLLHPDAVRQLHAHICQAPANVALLVAYLYDVQLDVPIQGVKIFRYEVVRRYPLNNVRSCEIDQLDRMRADGYIYAIVPAEGEADRAAGGDFPFRVLGLHGSVNSPRSVYERFRSMELARRKHRRKLEYMQAWPGIFVKRFLEHRDPLDFYALMGTLAGALSPDDPAGGEKDFQTYASLPGFDQAIEFMRDVSDGDVPE